MPCPGEFPYDLQIRCPPFALSNCREPLRANELYLVVDSWPRLPGMVLRER